MLGADARQRGRPAGGRYHRSSRHLPGQLHRRPGHRRVPHGRGHQARRSRAGPRPSPSRSTATKPDSGDAWSVVIKGVATEIERMQDVFDALDLPLFPWHSPQAPLRAHRAARHQRSTFPRGRSIGRRPARRAPSSRGVIGSESPDPITLYELDRPAGSVSPRSGVPLSVLTLPARRVQPDAKRNGEAPFFVRLQGSTLALAGGQHLDIDLLRFESLVDRAEDADHRGVPTVALELLEQAIGLWRGPCFAGYVYEEWAQATCQRVTERFVTAAIRAAELHLAAGRAARAVEARAPRTGGRRVVRAGTSHRHRRRPGPRRQLRRSTGARRVRRHAAQPRRRTERPDRDVAPPATSRHANTAQRVTSARWGLREGPTVRAGSR